MRSRAYWTRRAAALEAAVSASAEEKAAEIIRMYERAIENINADIRQTFKAYVATGIPDKEATRLLNAAENDKQYRELIKLLEETKDEKIKAEIKDRINAQAYGARISRMEGVKSRAYIQLRQAANKAAEEQKTLYTNTLRKSYYTSIYNIAEGMNCGIDFSLLPQRAISSMLQEAWHGSNYSERVWIHNDRFIGAVQQTIEDGITGGYSVNRMAEQLTEYVKDTAPLGVRTSTTALVRSETAHFMNQGQLAAYEEAGIKRYRFLAALSERTCDTCGNLDGHEFDVNEAAEGENYPPMHTNCRCTTVIADFTSGTRNARDPLTGKNYKVDGDMTFEKWKNSLTDEQQTAMKNYVDKSAGSGIIELKTGDKTNINGNLQRQTQNTGAFKELPERMSKKHIREIADKYDIDITGITLNIDQNEELLSIPIAGETIPESIGKITFFPNSFRSEEELVRTLYHEREHVNQFKEYGVEYVQNNREEFEKRAYKAENEFIDGLKKAGKL